jgi:hypothetical protein
MLIEIPFRLPCAGLGRDGVRGIDRIFVVGFFFGLQVLCVGYIRSSSDPNKFSDVAIFPGTPRLAGRR